MALSARLRKVNGNYYARLSDASRWEGRKSFPLKTSKKRVAEKRLRQLERDYDSGRFDPLAGGYDLGKSPTVAEVVDRFLEAKSHRRKDTIRSYRTILETALICALPNDLRISDLVPSHLHNVAHDDTVASATRRSRYNHIRSFLNWAVKEGVIEENPIYQIDAPKNVKSAPEYLSPDQVDSILQAIQRDYDDRVSTHEIAEGQLIWLKRVIRVAVGTGMRRLEVLSMRREHLDLDSGFYYIRSRSEGDHSFASKSGHEEAVPLVGDALEAVREQLDGGEGPWVFPAEQGEGHRNKGHVSRLFKRYVRSVGLPENISFHSLRHTCASWLAMQGVPATVIKEIMRHSSITVTERYMHVAPGQVRGIMQGALSGMREGEG